MIQARSTERRWSRVRQQERSRRLNLEENMETLAKQMTRIENQARQQFQRIGEESTDFVEPDDDDQFFDAPEISDADWVRTSSSPSTPTLAGSKMSLDTRSVNEAHGLVTPCTDRKQPMSSDRKITVSFI